MLTPPTLYRSLFRFSLILNLILVAAIVVTTSASYRYYVRALVAQHPVTPIRLGNKLAPEILFIGDSRVAQWAKSDSLNAQYLGFPGASSHQIENWIHSYRRESTETPNTVILQLGVNDLRLIGVAPDEHSRIVDSTTFSIERSTKRLAHLYPNVVLCALFPVGTAQLARRPVWSDQIGDAVEEINYRLSKVNWPTNVRFLDLSSTIASLGSRAFTDELHLSARSYLKVNEILAVALDREETDAIQ